MARISFKRHRFPADVIRHAVWLYFRFTLSFRDVEKLLPQRGIEVSYETVRCWTIMLRPQIAAKLRLAAHRPSHDGISTRWSATLAENASICGAPSTTKARCSISLFRSAATTAQR